MSPKEIEDVLGINIDYSKIDFENIFKGIQNNLLFDAFKNEERSQSFQDRSENSLSYKYENQTFNHNIFDYLYSEKSDPKSENQKNPNSLFQMNENSSIGKIEEIKEISFNSINKKSI